ncbi:MAG TPA: hypothetical protein VN281_23980, partial [Verrucomicrobiae bacterium]|nr:hypothetical protein [Verrucomicrobiae bacterium]
MKHYAQRIVIALLAGKLLLAPVWPESWLDAHGAPQSSDVQNAAGQQAQSKSGSATQTGPIRAASDVVRIDVEVTDKSGKPVKGLTANQFTITDDGKPQKISTFAYSDIEKIEMAEPGDVKPVVVPVDA